MALAAVARSAPISARTAFFSNRRGRDASQVECSRGSPCRRVGRQTGRDQANALRNTCD